MDISCNYTIRYNNLIGFLNLYHFVFVFFFFLLFCHCVKRFSEICVECKFLLFGLQSQLSDSAAGRLTDSGIEASDSLCLSEGTLY